MPAKNVAITISSDTTTAVAVLWSLVGDDVIVELNGVDQPAVTMAKLGEDRPTPDDASEDWACYYGTITMTGLTPLTENVAIAKQAGFSERVDFLSFPDNFKSKFSFARGTCFAPGSTMSDKTFDTGLLTIDTQDSFTFLAHYIKNMSEDYPYLGLIWSDDICYADGWFGTASDDVNSQGKKLVTNAQDGAASRPEYDYALTYAMWAGILTPFVSTHVPTVGEESGSAPLNEHFQYCLSKGSFLPSWGDHEFQNNIGWTGGKAMNDYPNGYWWSAGVPGAGLAVYNAVMKPLQGVAIKDESWALDTGANHYYRDIGPLRYIVADCITNAVAATTLYGDNQIYDILKAADANQWFTLFGRPAGAGRGFPAYEAAESWAYKDENFIQAEYDKLYVNENQSPQLSFMDNPRTNGRAGSMVTDRGDWHGASWLYFEAAATAGKVAESIHEIGLNTVNSSSGDAGDIQTGFDDGIPASDEGEIIGGITKDITKTPSAWAKPSEYVMTIYEIDGTLQTPVMIIKQWAIEYHAHKDIWESDWFVDDVNIERTTDEQGNVWRVCAARKIVLNAGDNRGYAVDDDDYPQNSEFSIIGGAEL